MCHHPGVASNRGGYSSNGPLWRENGMGITPSTGIYSTADISEDFMNTTLTITITVDHFRNKSFSYSCVLALAENGLPTGEVETSEEVTVDPVGPQQPTIKHIDCSINTSIAFNWTHTSMECYENRTSYYVSWVNIDNNTKNGSDVTGEQMYNITGLVANGNYTISVQAVVDSVNSTADTHNVTTGQPEVVCGNQPACLERNFTLYCRFSPVYEDGYKSINWTFNSTYINESDMYHISENQRELEIFNVVAITTGFYGCCIELKNGTFVEGMPYNLHPLGTPKPPQISVQTGISNINVSWEHDDSCFENYTFEFNVTWMDVDAANTVGSVVNVTTFNMYIQDLEPVTNYSICVLAASTSDKRVMSDTCQYYRTQPIMPSTKPEDTIAIAAGTAVAGGAVIFIFAVIIFLIACVVWRYIRSRKNRYGTKKSEQTESVSYRDLERRVAEQGNVQLIRNQPNTAPHRADHYADIDFTDDGPVSAPSQEKVAYTEVENIHPQSKDVDTPPELPSKQDQQQIKAFRDDVKAFLDKNGVLCKDLEEMEKLKGIRRDFVFTVEYNGIHFVASCVHTTSDLNSNHVDSIVEAKQVTGSTTGLLISNQSTIPSECLLTLEGAGCQFVPVSKYGEEGWQDRMIDKVKGVFPKVANNDSELGGPVQETSPPDDNGKLPTTYPKGEFLGRLIPKHDKEPYLLTMQMRRIEQMYEIKFKVLHHLTPVLDPPSRTDGNSRQ